jgi:hypothetical protein
MLNAISSHFAGREVTKRKPALDVATVGCGIHLSPDSSIAAEFYLLPRDWALTLPR